MTEETIFQEALARSAAERARFLDQACSGQPQLRAAVEALLSAHQKPDNLLDKPPGNLAATYGSLKQLDQSIPLFAEFLPLQEQKLGRNHPG